MGSSSLRTAPLPHKAHQPEVAASGWGQGWGRDREGRRVFSFPWARQKVRREPAELSAQGHQAHEHRHRHPG